MDDVGVVRRLRDAAVRVASGLELEAVLRNVVEAAAGLLDARYAALGVIGADRFLSEFIHTGFDGDIERVGHLPEGHGILGLLIHDAQTLRLEDLTTHPQSVGFPDGHPAMRAFLGVPVRVRDAVYGNLYLTEKRGGLAFTESDEQLATALAAAAGAAIDNAFLYRTTRVRERSLDAMAEISGAMLSGASDARGGCVVRGDGADGTRCFGGARARTGRTLAGMRRWSPQCTCGHRIARASSVLSG